MTLRGTFRYQEDETVRTLALPYRGGSTEFVVLLPTAPDGLAKLEASLDAASLAAWSSGGEKREVDLYLPRFRMKTAVDLMPMLQAAGPYLTDPQRVDLNGVGTDPRGPLFLTSVKQTEKRLEMKGMAQSSTRVSAFMRNIDASDWMDNPELEVVETKKDSALGSEFTLFANQVGVTLPGEEAEAQP